MSVYWISVHKLLDHKAQWPEDFELIQRVEVDRPGGDLKAENVFQLCREIEAQTNAAVDDTDLFARAITADLIRWKRDHFWPNGTAQTFGELAFVQSWNPPILGIPFVCSVTDRGIPELSEGMRVKMREALEKLEATR